MGSLNTPIVTMGVPLVAVAGVGIYLYRQNTLNCKKIADLELKIKNLEDTVASQKQQMDMVVQQFQQAFGTIQNQVRGLSVQQQMRPQAPPPSYQPEEDDMEDVPREIKKKVTKPEKTASLKEQAMMMERERGGNN